MQVDPAQEALFNDIISGVDPAEVEPALRALAPESRRAFLCALCAMHPEIVRVCKQPAELISILLTVECPRYLDGQPTCEDAGRRLGWKQSV